MSKDDDKKGQKAIDDYNKSKEATVNESLRLQNEQVRKVTSK